MSPETHRRRSPPAGGAAPLPRSGRDQTRRFAYVQSTASRGSIQERPSENRHLVPGPGRHHRLGLLRASRDGLPAQGRPHGRHPGPAAGRCGHLHHQLQLRLHDPEVPPLRRRVRLRRLRLRQEARLYLRLVAGAGLLVSHPPELHRRGHGLPLHPPRLPLPVLPSLYHRRLGRLPW